MANFNISSLFGGLNTGAFSSINFSDYASIKNGSYKKLLKSYYGQQKPASTSKTDTTTKKKKTETTDNTGLTKMKTEAGELKKAAEAFNKDDLWKQTDGKYDMDKILSAIKKFASEYNDVIDQSAKVSSKEVSQQTGFMTSMSKTMSGSLEKIGVKFGDDGKMSIDEETLKKADAKDLKAMFSGSYSYASQIAQKASAISSAALRSFSIYSSNGTLSSALSGMFNDWI